MNGFWTVVAADPLFIGGVVAVLAAVIALGLSVRYMFTEGGEDRALDRLERSLGADIDALPTARGITRVERHGALSRGLMLLSRLAQPEGEELTRAQARLTHAGFRGRFAVEVMFGAKVGLSLLLMGVFLGGVALYARPVAHKFEIAVILAALGFYAPNIWLVGRVEERQTELRRILPDTLDLLVTCVEAGLGIEAAIARVVEQMGIGAPILARELQQTMLEIRSGMARSEAFRRLASRTGLEELRSLAATIVQTELFGTSIGKALRVQAETIRIKRSQRAEERAATVPTRMVVPLVLCILPSLFAVIIGPAAVRMVSIVFPAMRGE